MTGDVTVCRWSREWTTDSQRTVNESLESAAESGSFFSTVEFEWEGRNASWCARVNHAEAKRSVCLKVEVGSFRFSFNERHVSVTLCYLPVRHVSEPLSTVYPASDLGGIYN